MDLNPSKAVKSGHSAIYICVLGLAGPIWMASPRDVLPSTAHSITSSKNHCVFATLHSVHWVARSTVGCTDDLAVFYKGLHGLMQIFGKSYANHRAPALFLTGWQPGSSVAPGTWRSFFHLRLARSLGLVPAALRVAVPPLRPPTWTPITHLSWDCSDRAGVGCSLCPEGNMFQAKSTHLGHGLTPQGSLLLYWVQFKVAKLLSKV